MWFTTFIVKNISRRPLRSLLTVFAIAIAIGSVVSLVGIANGFEDSFLSLYKNAKVDMLVVAAGGRSRLNSNLDETLGDKIKKISGVKEVLSGLADFTSIVEGNLYGVVVQGWEPETAVFDHLTVLEGRKLRKGELKAVMLGTSLANSLEKKPGDTLEVVEGKKYAVAGIFQSSNVLENGALVMPLKELQTILDRQGKVTGFSLILEHPKDSAEMQRIQKQIEALAPGLSAKPTEAYVKSLTEIRLARTMAWLTSCIALFIGFFGIMNTMVMSVHERTHEIGILRAVGWQVLRIMRMIVLESLFLSILGAVCGIIGATVLVRLLTRLPSVSGIIDSRIQPIYLVYGFLIAVLLGLLGSIVPAVRAGG